MKRKATTQPLVRVPARSYATLKALSLRMRRPMSDVVADALERYAGARFLEAANRDYARAGPDPERHAWDGTLLDGLEDEEWEEERRASASTKPPARRGLVGRPGSR